MLSTGLKLKHTCCDKKVRLERLTFAINLIQISQDKDKNNLLDCLKFLVDCSVYSSGRKEIMTSNQAQFENGSQIASTAYQQNMYQSPTTFQHQRPKPQLRQCRQNVIPYTTLSQTPSKSMVQVVQSNQTTAIPDCDWTFHPFEVVIKRNSLGLGFSIMGGPDAPCPFTKLIRIKKVFPLQPAWETGKLNPGDILLSAGSVSLCSLTIRQALDVLRSSHSGSVTRLIVCRPPPDNHPRQVFEELLQLGTNANGKSGKNDVCALDERPKIVQRSYSSCIATTGNNIQIGNPNSSMVQCGTPSREPLSISLFPNNKPTSVFCTSVSPTKPKRSTPEKMTTQTSIQLSEGTIRGQILKSEDTNIAVPDNSERRTSSPMDYEDNSNSDSNLILDDSVQSFAQSNGVNGPVYVDNSPERENDVNEADKKVENKSFQVLCNKAHFPQNRDSEVSGLLPTQCSSSESSNNNVSAPNLGTLDLLREIPLKSTNSQPNEALKISNNTQQYGEFVVRIKKVSEK